MPAAAPGNDGSALAPGRSGGGLRGYYAILDVRGKAAGTASAGAPGVGVGWDDEPVVLAAEVMRAEQLLAARPCCLQLRAKHLPVRSLLELAARLAPLCRSAGVPFCVNDRLDLALVVGADVVHLGQDDLSVSDGRRVLGTLGRSLMLGVSTHSLAQARRAEQGGADYIGFGPIFATGSKERPDPVVGLDGLRAVVAAVSVPVVAIGGIRRSNLAEVVSAGAAAAAVIADIENAGDRLTAAREVSAAFGERRSHDRSV
jgi:thiamine-phosphate pyrophosphorylase